MAGCSAWISPDRDPSGIMRKYHDEEWGVPLHDDQKQFEFLMLEALQCGLSWYTILKKRQIIRSCFDSFDFNKVAKYDASEVGKILNTPGMIRSERKIQAIIENAKCFQKIRREYGSFSEYLWSYSSGKTILYKGHETGCIPASNGLSKIISTNLKKRGFKYLGSVTIYAHLQACGIINDHSADCECYPKIIQKYPTVTKERFQEVGTVFTA